MLRITDSSGIALVTLDHGKVNALDLDLLHGLIDGFAQLEPDQPVVLTGAGRAFCAGVDLQGIAHGDDRYVGGYLQALSDCFLSVFDHAGPVIAAVNGAAIAGGCVIAAACDRRFISRGPIGLAELLVGVPFPTSAMEIMRSVLGSRTRQLVLTARNLEAQQALDIGLVDELVPPEALIERALEQAGAFRTLPPGVFAFTKQQLQAPTRARIAARSSDDQVMQQLWTTDTVRAAVTGYLDELRVRPASAERDGQH